jgi:hypothetical protein
MANLTRKDLEARYELFDHFALKDQRTFYDDRVEKFENSSSEVNRIRATVALLTGIAAALAGLITAIYFTTTGACFVSDGTPLEGGCQLLALTVDAAIIASVALPAIGGFFNTLADLYQWDKQLTLYNAAQENIVVADALSPLPEMDDKLYSARLAAYAEGTLQVMSDETAQWGQSIRTPRGVQEFVDKAEERAAELGGSADRQQLGSTDESDDTASSSEQE